MSAIGDRVRLRRKALGLEDDVFCEFLGCWSLADLYKQIVDPERSDPDPSDFDGGDIIAFCKALDCSADWLLELEREADEAGVSLGPETSDGEAELILTVGDETTGHRGSVWISKEFWQAVADKAWPDDA